MHWENIDFITIIISFVSSVIFVPIVNACFNRKNTRKQAKSKMQINTISELISKMKQLNGYLFILDGDALDNLFIHRYYEPIINAEFVNKHKTEFEKFSALLSNTTLFWKENEELFQEIGSEEVIEDVTKYFELVEKLRLGIKVGMQKVERGDKKEVSYPEFPIEIFLNEAPIELGKLRWEVINNR